MIDPNNLNPLIIFTNFIALSALIALDYFL